MYKAIIVDDDLTSIKSLQKVCEKLDNVSIIKTFQKGIEALKYLKTNPTDLVFLDVEMPGLTGIDIISTIDYLPNIIITSSESKYAVDAFEYDVKDYLLKPVSKERLEKALTKLSVSNEEEKAEQNNSTSLFVKVDSGLIQLDFAEILWIEANGDYLSIKTKSKTHIINSTLKKILNRLPENIFFKVHRSYIVNLSHCKKIEDHYIIFDKKSIPVSRQQWPVFLDKINVL